MFNDPKEVLGLLASLIILIALVMPNIKTLRIINLFGAILMTIYGILIVKMPVVIMNCGSVLINIYYLYKMYINKPKYEIITTHKDENLFKFLTTNNNDIESNVIHILMKDNQILRSLEFVNSQSAFKVINSNGTLTETEKAFIVNFVNENYTINHEIEFEVKK